MTPAAASAIALERYGLEASATPLPSERDQNFLLETPDGGRFVLKMSNAADDRALLEAQNAAMAHVSGRKGLCPRVIVSVDGEPIVSHDEPSTSYLVRMLSWIPGTPLGAVPHHSSKLLEDLGRRVGEIDRALATFDRPAIHRELQWDLARGVEVVRDHAPAVQPHALGRQLEDWTGDIARHVEPRLRDLRRSAVHNDANDHNVIVAREPDAWPRHQRIAGIIDFGDIVHSFVAADPAIAIAYAMLDKPDPLAAAASIVNGYHAAWPLKEPEIAALFDLARLRLCMSVALAAYQQAQRPGDAYLGISQGPIARTLPELMKIPRRLAEAAFRDACGLDPVPASTRITSWLETRSECAPIVAMDPAATLVLDLSVGSPLISGDPAGNAEPALTARIERTMAGAHAEVAIGRYGEPRLLYSSPLFEGGPGGERRTIHLGVDLFAPPGTVVHAPLPGVVHAVGDNAAPLDYGPVIILKHETDELDPFYTLYGHLTRQSLGVNPIGRRIDAGEPFAAIGAADTNGGWTPHLHFQLIAALLDLGVDFPGVCRASQRRIWQALSPDPHAFLRMPDASFPDRALDSAAAATERKQRIGANVALSYRDPVRAVRGWMQYLFDDDGRRYLDAYNNVPHVGHCHPRVVQAVSEQMAVLNTNTRYLHDGARASRRAAGRDAAGAAERLLLRQLRERSQRAGASAGARAHAAGATSSCSTPRITATRRRSSTSARTSTPAPAARGAPGLGARAADAGRLSRRVSGERTPGRAVRAARWRRDRSPAHARRRGACAASSRKRCPSVGGQIILPAGYLADVYRAGARRRRRVHRRRSADRLRPASARTSGPSRRRASCRTSSCSGKPIGNGYPIGAVVTTPAIAASFDNGMEFFSTFGGNTVACAAGLAVLDVVQRRAASGTRAARRRTARWTDCGPLQARYGVVGDVRGSGLFLGVELVRDRGDARAGAGRGRRSSSTACAKRAF